MSAMRLIQTALTSMLLLALAADSADACSCGTGPVCSHFFQVDAVFTGTVQSISEEPVRDGSPSRMLRVQIGVDAAFRGPRGPVVTILTADSGPSCGYSFKQGERYLVYAHRGENGATLEVSLCSRTQPIAKAGDDLRFIQELSTGRLSSRVYGSITHMERDLAADRGREYPPIPDVLVSVRGAAGTTETWTDDQGRYEIKGLPPGMYDVMVFPPANFTANRLQQPAELRDPRSCAVATFNLVYDNRISGEVRLASGELVEGAQVEMMAAERVGALGNIQTLRTRSEPGGRFEFNEVPQGRYVIGVDLTRRMDPTIVFPRTFYVRTGDATVATVVEIDGGRHQDLEPITVQSPRRAVTMTGTVKFEDGRPASEVFISLHDGVETWRQVAVGIKTTGNGTFSFAVHEGLTYIASASSSDVSGGERKYLSGTVGPFVVSDRTGPIDVVLRPRK